MDKIEQLDRILIDYNLGNIKRHKAREKICLLFDVVGQSEQLPVSLIPEFGSDEWINCCKQMFGGKPKNG
jgi:hypothetical protein